MGILGLVGLLGTVNSSVSAVTSLYKPFSRSLDYTTNKLTPNNLNDPSTMLTLYFKKVISRDTLYNSMLLYGYNKSQVDFQIQAAQRMLDITEYIQLWRRGKLESHELTQYARRIAFDESELENLKNVTEYFPTPGDIIRFAVREVYTPETIQRFGMMEDIPNKYLTEAEKAGISDDQARNLWAAHWELPSLQMGYAMLHRRIISEADLDMLMKSQDVMPFWRDKLKRLSYAPLTRVDARRMYGFGVLSYAELIDSYKDIGYSEVNATRLADFTVKYEDDEYTGLTRSTLIDSFTKNLLTEEQLREYLAGIGYGQSVIEFWVNNAVYQKTLKEIEKRTNELRQAFLDGVMTLEHIRVLLVEDGIPNIYIEEVLNDFRLTKVNTYKNPSFEVLYRWLEKGIIDETRFNIGMRRLGYDEEVIVNYMTEIMDPNRPIKRKFLKYETYVEWYMSDIIDQRSLESKLSDMGYIRSDIEIIVSQANEEKYTGG